MIWRLHVQPQYHVAGLLFVIEILNSILAPHGPVFALHDRNLQCRFNFTTLLDDLGSLLHLGWSG